MRQFLNDIRRLKGAGDSVCVPVNPGCLQVWGNLTLHTCDIDELQICQSSLVQIIMENLEGSIFAWLFGCLLGFQASNSSYFTLAFGGAQVICPFSSAEKFRFKKKKIQMIKMTQMIMMIQMIDRPGVAGAVLQTASSLIN